MGNRSIKWGIVGLGNIANQFASDLVLIENAELTAVASRDFSKAEQFGGKFNALRMYNSYDLLFEDPEVDIVYIATPHNSHAELSIKALESGKHVLCEKPLAQDLRDAEAILQASRQAQRVLAVGMTRTPVDVSDALIEQLRTQLGLEKLEAVLSARGFKPEDFAAIEAKMREIIARNDAFMREEWDREDAIRFFTEPDGWVGHFTGTDIAQKFPRYIPTQAS